MEQRLQKLLAAAGIASRRACEALIAAGRVTVNGISVTQLGTRADPEADDIRVDGRPIAPDAPRVYLLLNKPIGYVTTVRDRHAEKTVLDLVHGVPGRLYPVGRLDADSAGLLILTNDGAFTEKLTHPKHQVRRTYRAVVRGEIESWALTDLRKGVLLDDGMTAPAEADVVDYDRRNNASVVDVTLHEGRNRQVRRMLAAVGYPVLALTRIRIGPIDLTGLAPGTWRKLRAAEVKALLAAADNEPPALPQQPVDEAAAEPQAAVRGPTAAAKPRFDGPAQRPAATDAIREAARDLSRKLGRDSRDEGEQGRSRKTARTERGKPRGEGRDAR